MTIEDASARASPPDCDCANSRPGEIYIIEDIYGAHEAYMRREIAATVAKHGLRAEWFDLRLVKNRFDDILAYTGL